MDIKDLLKAAKTSALSSLEGYAIQVIEIDEALNKINETEK